MDSIVVFDVDGLSLRTAGCYGNVECSTPHLDEFAAQARVFEHHYRSFVDSYREREHVWETLLQDSGATGLRLTSGAATAASELAFSSSDELAEALEARFDSEDMICWVRWCAPDAISPPLELISALIENRVSVALTSACPIAADDADAANTLDNAAAIRVPLMVWSGEPTREQSVTSSSRLFAALQDDVAAETDGSSDVAVIVDENAVAIREPDCLLRVDTELLPKLADVSDADLADVVDMTDDRIQMFRKPDDVWNVHNVLVEDFPRALQAFVRLRTFTSNR